MITIQNTTKGKLPRLPFARMTTAALGPNYDLSFVIINPYVSRKINRTYRGKNSSTNILSFALTKTEGEIFLDLAKACTEANLFYRTQKNFIAFLFIHALCHLKGFEHSSRMERQEQKIRALFNV
jgi:probable rRNA maturation factor